MIWQMSALMRLGLPPLLAVRLPTMLAALATVGAVWGVCRYALRDRTAAAIAGFLLLSSLYYTDPCRAHWLPRCPVSFRHPVLRPGVLGVG